MRRLNRLNADLAAALDAAAAEAADSAACPRFTVVSCVNTAVISGAPRRSVGIRRLLRGFAELAAAMFNVILLTPIASVVLYDLTAFRPHAAAITAIIANADPENADPPPLVRELLLAEYRGKSGLAVPVARQLLMDTGHTRMRGLEWHTTFFLWSGLVCLHYSDAEIAAVFASRAYVGAGRYGLNAAALARFDKPLSRLSAEEAAEIIAITWSPALMLANPAALDRRKAIILLRYAERRAIQRGHYGS